MNKHSIQILNDSLCRNLILRAEAFKNNDEEEEKKRTEIINDIESSIKFLKQHT